MAKNKELPPVGGVYAALTTPRRIDSVEADAAAMLDYVDLIARSGVDGLVLFGSTGEFVHFSTSERMRVLSLSIRRSRVPVLVNVSHSTFAGVLDLTENAMQAGAAGVLLMPPYFYRYTEAQIFEFYQLFSVAVRDAIRIYLYNLPFFTNPISPGLALRLLESGHFAGIKDSSGTREILDASKGLREVRPITFLSGSESIYLDCRRAGADGIVSGVAAALPELVVALDRAIRKRDEQRAGLLNARLAEFVRWIERFPATIGIKQAAVARGWKIHNHFAFPLDEESQADLAAFHNWFLSWFPGVLTECSEPAAARA